MEVDDVIYGVLLLFCIGFGWIYRQVDNGRVNRKRWIGSAVGLGLVTIVSGVHVLHLLFSFAVATLLVMAFDVRIAHVLTFIFTFSYLIIMRTIGHWTALTSPSSYAILVQMVFTVKIIGLAYERNKTASETQSTEKHEADGIAVKDTKDPVNIQTISVEDVFHYSFNYATILIGPYTSYATFSDYFSAQHWKSVNCEFEMLKRLKWATLFAALLLSCTYVWPINFIMANEFYFERSALYRLWYCIPTFFNFRMRLLIGLTLSECICIMAGFGARPKASTSSATSHVIAPTGNGSTVRESDIDFGSIYQFNVFEMETAFTLGDTLKGFHLTTKSWLATAVNQLIPLKYLGMFTTFAVFALWCGLYPGYFVSLLSVPAYVHVESIWNGLYRERARGLQRSAFDIAFWISKTFVTSFLAMSFLLMTGHNILYYYRSVYFVGFIWGVFLYLLGLLLELQETAAGGQAHRKSSASGKKPEMTTPASFQIYG